MPRSCSSRATVPLNNNNPIFAEPKLFLFSAFSMRGDRYQKPMFHGFWCAAYWTFHGFFSWVRNFRGVIVYEIDQKTERELLGVSGRAARPEYQNENTMKDYWKIIVRMAVPLIRAAGEAKKAEDPNTSGKDDLIGMGLVFLADFAEWLIAGGEGPAPKAPAVIR